MSEETPEALLKSALEKIVYFEARSSQLSNDADTSRTELERLRIDLASAAQREIELRRVIAELEVRATRAHAEREEMARVVDALRRERAELVGKMLEASRIHGLDQGVEDFDLAQFIAQLRQEVLLKRDGSAAPVAVSSAATVTGVAHELKAQGRLMVSASDIETLTGARDFPGRSEETLFGFSVRELSALDASARVRAAERLEALRHPAAAPALATALHSESESSVQVALLSALASLAKAEAVPVVQPLLTSTSPDVRIAALKALLKLDPGAAGPHLAAATKNHDKAVRRRASLLALGLSGKEALELGTQTIRDADADVRALAALVLGASNAEVARPMLLDAMRDSDLRVRRAASQSLSRLLGQDVTSLVGLEDAHRRREVRKLANVPAAPVATKLPLPRRERVGERAQPQLSRQLLFRLLQLLRSQHPHPRQFAAPASPS
ncbi:MAG: HEAT repeat domain-containing protein [Archangium sp.]